MNGIEKALAKQNEVFREAIANIERASVVPNAVELQKLFLDVLNAVPEPCFVGHHTLVKG